MDRKVRHKPRAKLFMARGEQIVTQLLFNLSANSAELKRGLDQANSHLSNFSNNLKKIGSAIGVAFGTREILAFGAEITKLAGEFKGVENAYKKIQGSEQLMIDLKRATAGTVSELDLMKRAVQFSNFGLELSKLPGLLEFATLRASQTGMSIEFLVDSIVTGLGRKSVLILDNLGISATQLNAEIEKTGDFMTAVGNIVDQQLGQMGNLIETSVTKTERLNASWINFKTTLGETLNESGFFGEVMDGISGSLDVASSKNLSFWEKALAFLSASQGGAGLYTAKLQDAIMELQKAEEEQKKQSQVIKEVDRAYVEFNKDIDAYAKAISTHQYKTELLTEFTRRLTEEETKRAAGVENIVNLQARLAALQEQQLVQTGAKLVQTNQEIKQIEEKIKALKELGVAEKEARKFSAIPQSIVDYQKEIAGNRKANQKQTDKGATGLLSPDSAVIAAKNMDMLNEKLSEHNGQLIQIKDGYSSLSEGISEGLAQGATNAIYAVGDALTGMLSGQKKGFKDLVSTVLSSISQIINALFAQAIAGMIAGESKKGLIGLATAAIGVAALTALWKSKVEKKRESGGYSSGLTLVGERGPEVVNLPRGSRVHSNFASANMMQGKIQVEVIGRLAGDDIYLANARAEQKRYNSR